MVVVLGSTDELRRIFTLQLELLAQMNALQTALAAQKDSFDKLTAAVQGSTFAADDVAAVEAQTAAQDALTASLTPPAPTPDPTPAPADPATPSS